MRQFYTSDADARGISFKTAKHPDYTILILSTCLLRIVQNSMYFSSLSMYDIIKPVWQAGYLVHVFRVTFRGVKLDLALTERDSMNAVVVVGGSERTSNALIWTNNVSQDWITSYTGETVDYSKT